jgi:hypothetical protein
MSNDDAGFDLRLLGPTPADRELGRELFQQGVSFQTIRQRLLHSGLKPEHVETVILDIAGQEVQSLVVAGSSQAVIFDRLAPRGLNDDEVAAVIQKLTKKTARRARSTGVDPNRHNIMNTFLIGRLILWFGRIMGLV